MPQPKAYWRAAAKMLGLHKSSKAQWKTDEDDTPLSPSFSHSNGRRVSVTHQFYTPIQIHKRSQDPSPATLPHNQHMHQCHHHHQPSENHKQHHRRSIISSKYYPRYPSKNTVTLYRRATILGTTSSSSNTGRSSTQQSATSSLQSLYSLSTRPYPPTSTSKLYRRSGPVLPTSSSMASCSQSSLGNSSLSRSKSMPSRARRIMRQSTAYVFDTHLISDTLIHARSITTVPLKPTRTRSLTASRIVPAAETKRALVNHTDSEGLQQATSTPVTLVVESDSQTGTDAPDTFSPPLSLPLPQHDDVKADSITVKPSSVLDTIVPTSNPTANPGSNPSARTSTEAAESNPDDRVNHQSTKHRNQDTRVLHSGAQQQHPAMTMDAMDSPTLSHLRRMSQVAAKAAVDSETVASSTAAVPPALDAGSHVVPYQGVPYTNKLDKPLSAECARFPPRPAIMQRHSSVAAMSLCSVRSQSSSRSYRSGSGDYCSASIQTYESEQSQLEANLRHHSDILPTMDEMMAKVGHCLASEGGHRGAQLVDHGAARAVAQYVEVVDPSQIAIIEPCSAKIETWVN
ncbi:hypothetical protein BGZ73_004129 [Actinomortierella ambigua]|nr:hypothetical protein BGZ73_004129 [Actinomortierella ambigua]